MEASASDLKIVEVVSLGDAINKPSTSNTKPKEKSVHTAGNKPLLMLIKLLVNFVDNEEKTILTNSQLMNILHNEFDIDIWNLPTLAIEIYMNVLKKFLKMWPRWDAVDTIVQKSKVDKSINIESILLEEYESLKIYLKEMLDLSRGPMEATMKKVSGNSSTAKESKKVILEVHCSRQQLNTLIFRTPDPANLSIFNSNPKKIMKIRVSSPTFAQICYWPGFSMEIDTTKAFQYSRRNLFDMTHTLVNHKLDKRPEAPTISLYVHCKSKKNNVRSEVPMGTITSLINNILDLIEDIDSEYTDILRCIFEMIKKDISHCPQVVDRNSNYLYYLNPYPYVRHLYQDNEGSPEYSSDDKDEMKKYDLELQEFISPNVVFSISPLQVRKDGTIPDIVAAQFLQSLMEDREQLLRFKCTYCELVLSGLGSVGALQAHFGEAHFEEPNTTCTHCGTTFSVQALASACWFHKC